MAHQRPGIVGALIGNWLAAVFGVRFTGGIDWIRHILRVGAAAVLIAIVGPMSMRQWPARPFFTSAMATATTSTTSP